MLFFHAGLSVSHFKGSAVGTFERSAAVVPSSVQTKQSVTDLDKNFLIIFSKEYVNLCFFLRFDEY